jgi:hypothetical protein
MSLPKMIQAVPRDVWRRVLTGFAIVLAGFVLFYFAVYRTIRQKAEHSRLQESLRKQEIEELITQRKELAALEQNLDYKIAQAEKNSAPPPSQVGRSSRETPARNHLWVDFSPKDAFQSVKRGEDQIYIPTGAVFQGKLITPIKTSIHETFLMAETTAEFRMDSKRFIQKGSRLIGRARLNPVLKGVMVEFYRLVNPQGLESSITALALSETVFPELEGLFFSNDLERYSTALAFGFLSGFSDAAKDRSQSILGTFEAPTWRNRVLNGVSTASFQIAEDLIREIREKAIEYVIVPAGENIFIALTNRYVMDGGKQK